uniref:Uncharacterized protein n=1 Tax=Arundo donax TaxID=35708 RepID=A0A0A8YLK6_ARUDO
MVILECTSVETRVLQNERKSHGSNARELTSRRSTTPSISYAFPSPSGAALESIPWRHGSSKAKHGNQLPWSHHHLRIT